MTTAPGTPHAPTWYPTPGATIGVGDGATVIDWRYRHAPGPGRHAMGAALCVMHGHAHPYVIWPAVAGYVDTHGADSAYLSTEWRVASSGDYYLELAEAIAAWALLPGAAPTDPPGVMTQRKDVTDVTTIITTYRPHDGSPPSHYQTQVPACLDTYDDGECIDFVTELAAYAIADLTGLPIDTVLAMAAAMERVTL